MGESQDVVRCEVDGSVAVMTLNRPDARNAISPDLVTGLITTLDALELDERVRVVIVTGEGKAFSAGGDLKLMREKEGMFEGGPVRLRTRYLQGIQQIPRRFERFSKPVIAAVNGAAIGAGLDLATMADIRVASTRAKFGSTFVKVGLIPGDGGAYLLARVVGFPRSLELILTGRVIDADEALAIGLVHNVVEPDRLMSAAREQAELIAANAPQAVRLAKALCYEARDSDLDRMLRLSATYQGIVQNTDDHMEGVEAILGRRTPEFKGT